MVMGKIQFVFGRPIVENLSRITNIFTKKFAKAVEWRTDENDKTNCLQKCLKARTFVENLSRNTNSAFKKLGNAV